MEQRLILVRKLEPTAEQAVKLRGTPQAFVIRTTIPNQRADQPCLDQPGSYLGPSESQTHVRVSTGFSLSTHRRST